MRQLRYNYIFKMIKPTLNNFHHITVRLKCIVFLFVYFAVIERRKQTISKTISYCVEQNIHLAVENANLSCNLKYTCRLNCKILYLLHDMCRVILFTFTFLGLISVR